MYSHSTYDKAVKLISEAMACQPKLGIQKAQNAQTIFRNMSLWPEYAQARALESQLRLKIQNDRS